MAEIKILGQLYFVHFELAPHIPLIHCTTCICGYMPCTVEFNGGFCYGTLPCPFTFEGTKLLHVAASTSAIEWYKSCAYTYFVPV